MIFFSKTEHLYNSDIFKLLSEIRQILRVTTAQQTMTPVLSAGQCTENAECDPKNYAIKGCDILHLPHSQERAYIHLTFCTSWLNLNRYQDTHITRQYSPILWRRWKIRRNCWVRFKKIPTPLKFEKIDWLTCLKTCHKASNVKWTI